MLEHSHDFSACSIYVNEWQHIWLNEGKPTANQVGRGKQKKNVRNLLFEGQNLAIILWNTETIKPLNDNNIVEICLRRICAACRVNAGMRWKDREWESFWRCWLLCYYHFIFMILYAWIWWDCARKRDNLVLVFYWCPSDLSLAKLSVSFDLPYLCLIWIINQRQSTWRLVYCFISELWLFHWPLLHFNETQTRCLSFLLLFLCAVCRSRFNFRPHNKDSSANAIVVSKKEAHYKRTTI